MHLPPLSLRPPPNRYKLVCKDTLTSPVSALISSDYRMSGAAELLVVGTSGEVRGYIPTVASGLDSGGELLGRRKQQVRSVGVDWNRSRGGGSLISRC